MNIGYNLNLKQKQKLSMTPQLQQAIKILQFNSLELNDYINKQIEENPLLEMESIEEDREEEIDWKEYIKKHDDIGSKPQISKNNEKATFESFVSYSQSLTEYLIEQLGILHLDKELKFISTYLIESLDNNGYLHITLSEVSSLLKVDIEATKTALEVVQSLEPLGIGATDLRDCLLLQVKDIELKKEVKAIIQDHLEDLALNKLTKISKDLNLDILKVQQAIDYIKTLEPKPGRSFSDDSIQRVNYITPDANIEIIDGEYKVIINESSSPRLNINSFYKNLIAKESDNKADNEATTFLTENLNSATWIIRSIEQRKNTLKKVIESIMKFQMDFLVDGPRSLKPLTLKMIADNIDMHESTISRSTNDKYVKTPRGIFELKYFFTTGLNSSKGEISSTSIKSMIGEIIETEDLTKPYSDQKISDLLKQKGTIISRRTVAKYRDELQIPSSTLRKRFD